MDSHDSPAEAVDIGAVATPWWRRPQFFLPSAGLLVMVVLVLLLTSNQSGVPDAQATSPSPSGPAVSSSPSGQPFDGFSPSATPSETAPIAVTSQAVETTAPPQEVIPVLTSVSAPSSVTCGTPSVSTPFTVSWQSSGATNVWVAQHETNAKGAPGAIGPLSSNGSRQLDFPCHGSAINYVVTAESSSGALVHKTFSVSTTKAKAVIVQVYIPSAQANCSDVGPWDTANVQVDVRATNYAHQTYLGWGSSAASPHNATTNVTVLTLDADGRASFPVPYNCATSSLAIGFSVLSPWGEISHVSGTMTKVSDSSLSSQ